MGTTAEILQLRRFTVDDYHRMVPAGILGPDDRVELIDGAVIEMTPIGSRHAGCVNRLNQWFMQRCLGRATVQIQGPLRLSRWSEVEPDLLVLRQRADFYAGRHARPADVRLLIEVADSSLRRDREIKMPLYAQSRIPLVWLVDVERRVVRAHRSPSEGAFRRVEDLRSSDELPLPRLVDGALRVADLFG
jgi:Uma2 family endonuclease